MFGRTVVILFIAMLVAVVGGTLLAFLGRSRAVSDVERGRNNLRQLAAFAVFHAAAPGDQVSAKQQDFFPPATLPTPGIETGDRLSWAAYVLPTLDRNPKGLEEGKKSPLFGVWTTLDPKIAWNKGANDETARRQVTQLLSPSSTSREAEGGYPKTSYLASIGAEAAGKVVDRGLFDFNERTPFTAVTDGMSNTISFVETAIGNGPWLRGGSTSTFHPDVAAMEGEGLEAVVGKLHPRGFLASFADGSVRFMTYKADEKVFRSQLSIAGTEVVP